MKLTKKIEIEVLKVYDSWLHSYLNGDVATYDSYLDEEYHFIGSTNNEEFLSRKDTTNFFKQTAEQLAGKCDLRNETRTLEQFGELIFVTHFFDAWFLNDTEYNYYGRFRFTSALRKNKEGWRFIYQHFSMPDSKTEEGETIGFEKINEENQQLREAIQRRTVELELKNRELEVEGALERIRAQAVAMKESSDLLDIVVTMRTEFINLGHEAHYFWHMMWLPEKYEKAMTSGDGTKIGFVMELPRHIHGDIPLLSKWEKSNDPIIIYPMDTEAALAYVEKMVTLGDFQNIDPQAPSEDDIRHIGGLTFIMARTTHGEIGYSLPGVVENPPKEDLKILEKFAGAFDLAHRRFLDLKKAEKQTREVAIELGLEKVRSRSLAMHSSDELRDASALLFIEITKLGIESITSGYVLLDEDEKIGWNYMPDPSTEKIMPIATGVFHDKTDNMKSIIKNWKKQVPVFVLDLDEKQTIAHQTFIAEESLNFPISAEKLIAVSPSQLKLHTFNFRQGYLLIVGGELLSDNQVEIMLRFTKVFQQTYTRFLDLQKAEAQAKEAEIELALERVRARTMAMHNSSELAEVAALLFEQVKHLGIDSFSSGFNIWDKEHKNLLSWMSNATGEINPSFELPIMDFEQHRRIFAAWKKKESFLEDDIKGKALTSLYKFLRSFPLLDASFAHAEKAGIKIADRQVHNIAFFSNGYLLFITKEPTPQYHSIFQRFGKVFDQTYTRFLDLQKAEKQARESEIELALERVRARTMAMQHSDELQEASFLLDQQVRALGIKTWGCAFNIYGEKESTEWFGNEAGVLPTYKVPRTGIFKEYYQKGQIGESLLIKEFSGDACVAHYEYMSSLPVIGDVLKNLKKTNNGFPTYQIDHVVYFKYGYLLFITREPAPDAHDIFIRFAKVFEQTYTRFLDLQKAEAQARETQIELALERVRARTMSMQRSDELTDTSMLLFQQIEELGINSFACVFNIWDDDKKAATAWMASKDRLQPPFKTNSSEDVYVLFHEAEKRGESLFILEQKGKELEEHYKYLVTIPEVKKLSEAGLSFPTFQIIHCAYFSKGYLMFITLEPVPDAHDVFKRFAKVFEQTYTRFLDLQKAEAQAREAQIEAALERTRTQSMLMQHSDELDKTSQVFHEQLHLLGIDSEFSYLWLPDEKKSEHQFWATWFEEKKGKIQYKNKAVTYPLDKTYPAIAACYVAWESDEAIHVNIVAPNEVDAYFETWKELLSGAVKFKPKHFPDGLYYVDAYMKYGCFGIMIKRLLSEDEKTILNRFAKEFERTYTRFLDLKKAEAQAQEAKIEASLEKVRNVALTLKKSDDMLDIAQVLYEQLLALGFTDIRNAIIDIHNNDTKTFLDYDYSHDMSSAVTQFSFYGDPVIEKQIKKIESSNDAFFEIELKGKELEELIETRLRNGEKDDPRLRQIDHLTYNLYSFGNGAIGISNFGILSDYKKKILKRFRNVFTFAYKRYTDLANAEAQAREAQIEAGLEKVRSVALILKKSEDMLEVAQALYEQLLVLGFANIRNSIIDIDNDNGETFLDYDYSHQMGGTVTLMSYKDDPTLKEQLEDIIATTDGFSEMVLEGKQLQDLIEMRRKNGEEDDPRLLKADSLSYILYAFGNGAIGISNFGVLTINQKAILDRFRNVFTYSYKRYTDLRTSEAQAREAQIEAALEKVRSRSLAMHKPDELQEVIAVVAEKLTELGVIFDAGGVILCTYFPDNKDVVHWIVAPDFSGSGSYFVPYFDNPIFKDAWDSKIRGDAYFSKEFTLEAKNHFFEYAFEHSDYKKFPEDYKQHVLKADKHNLSAAWSKNSAIIIPSLTGVVPSESEAEIIKRFAKVFEQAYIRFMDLQKAEERARESQIDIALERVRSRTMGMQKSDELAETSAVLFKQIKEIATETWSCGFCIWQENDEVELWMGADSGGILPPMLIPYKEEPTHRDIYKASLRKEPEYNKVWKGKALKEHYAFLRTIPSVAKAIKVMEDSGLTLPDQQCYYVGFFKHGYLLLITKEPNDNLIELSKRFTNVFDLTYTRFLDLQLKEKQSVELLAEKQRLEITLTDLQATQKQLIQSEKMASLGELTAGIAHEIQNPLNFVNNFSELSNELIDEMNAEIEKGDMEEAKFISKDIKQNLEKIYQHGKRAEAIVKGMLQHSRKTSEEKEPTDLNKLADEYLRLAYHGLRARDKSFNATLVTDYDESIGNILAFPQDLGRVILNLVTNAFYAVNEKQRSPLTPEGGINGSETKYEPTVWVNTKRISPLPGQGSFCISVKDNGNGIPKQVLEKIFQPFFTTKPTGQGTGLGLSMSYDIITTGHGGELTVKTEEGNFTEFTISLPTAAILETKKQLPK